jgi:hypothetical protein
VPPQSTSSPSEAPQEPASAHRGGLRRRCEKPAGWRRVSHLAPGICRDFAGSAMPPADEAESHQSHNGPPDGVGAS